jgi:hypothetical protein
MNDVLHGYGLGPLTPATYYAVFHFYFRWRAPQTVKHLFQDLEVGVGVPTTTWFVNNMWVLYSAVAVCCKVLLITRADILSPTNFRMHSYRAPEAAFTELSFASCTFTH